MIIKTAIVGVGVIALAGGTLIAWPIASSYVRTTARVAGQTAADAVPVGFEIERLETLVRDLDQTMQEQRARLVKQRVDLEYLQREVERAEQQAQSYTAEVRAARTILASHQSEYRIGDRMYARERVVTEAGAKADQLIRAKAIAEAKRKTMEALSGALQQAEGQIAQAAQKREQYALRLSELRATAENVAIRKQLVTSIGHLPSGVDTGAFQEVEEVFARIEKELQVQDRLLEEQFDSVPKPSEISFTDGEHGPDVLTRLDRALGVEAEDADDASVPVTFLPGDETAALTE